MLRQHILTQAVLDLLSDGPATPVEMLELLPRRGAYNWGAAIRQSPTQAATALARFVALLSHARDPESPEGPEDSKRPFLHIETHIWVRAVSRLLRMVSHTSAFAWIGESAVLDADSTFDVMGKTLLPSVYCRHCGRSGWAAYSPERDPAELVTSPEKIYRAAVGPEEARRCADHGRRPGRGRGAGRELGDPGRASGRRVRPLDPRELDRWRANGVPDGVFVLADLDKTEANSAAEQDRCPACGWTRASGSSVRAWPPGLGGRHRAVRRSQLAGQRKTLLFNDSVQDAAHRAGFVANRSYAFSLRRLLAPGYDTRHDRASLNDLVADLVAVASAEAVLPSVVPPDLHDRPSGRDPGAGDRRVAAELGSSSASGWRSTIMEFGLRSRQGRTLELTRTAAAEVVLGEPAQDRRARRGTWRTGCPG